MSGQDIPYYLRPNKHVERQIFIEILSHVNAWNKLIEYLYVSMGGKFLEDIKQIHSALNIKKLVSIERDKITFERQQFNRPLSLIDCLNMTSGDLVNQIGTLLDSKGANNCIVRLCRR
ncbi:O-methyltransferase [Methylovulum psychrotolerans]|uniref:Uncharacterized protein n=1 Tax=Methylovulum psychrotolerans TaxID=1704499 RepID=A0A2S5CQD4_9GAMM|nr:O-methyltransferase [Methylovulum psychrotolerans]POZ52996.1 hypothetical protein AADEFJLK_00005 [Methylovulum psychrotolerans]